MDGNTSLSLWAIVFANNFVYVFRRVIVRKYPVIMDLFLRLKIWPRFFVNLINVSYHN